MGSSLSGGQKQRVLLARALYKNPKLLFLDEATSHLDAQRESLINDAVKQLSLTRIVVAHRPTEQVDGGLIFIPFLLGLAATQVSGVRR